MTDVRAILEEQARRHAVYNRALQAGVALLCAVTILGYAAAHARGRHVDYTLFYMPLLLVGGVSVFTPKHLQALREAVADPDPALDAHFARALVSDSPTVAKLGRQAFVQRFENRLPTLDEEGWENVGWGLKTASTDEAEAMLSLLSRGAPTSAIERIEDFRKETKVDRLRTAAHQTLAEIRLRIARERVVDAVETADRAQAEERERLRL